MDTINVIPRPAKVISGEGEFVIKHSTSICASSDSWKVARSEEREGRGDRRGQGRENRNAATDRERGEHGIGEGSAAAVCDVISDACSDCLVGESNARIPSVRISERLAE